jgi:protein-S-isoprenylcysteine O-methyltransferase Ste14
MKVFNHLRAVLLLPVMVVVIVPALIIWTTGSANIGWGPVPLNILSLLVGLLFICLGLILIVQTNILFIKMGRGTLAPWDPTRKLVVHGVYRHVRNPMITGVCSLLLGEVILFGSLPLLAWFLVVVVANLICMPLFEEPGLERRFGDDYRLYKQHVPRWIPRRTPWEGPSEG